MPKPHKALKHLCWMYWSAFYCQQTYAST